MKIGIARKLAIVCLAFGLPIVVMFVLMTKAKLGEIDFGSKEIVGNTFQRPLEDTLQHVARHRRLWLRSRRGEGGTATAMADEARAIAGALERVIAEDAVHGEVLEFTPEGLGLRQRDEFTARGLQAKWRALSGQLATIDTESGDRAHQALVTHIRTMITHAGDCSNLILDPDLDSYYLMDVTLLTLPQMEERLQQMAVDIDRLAFGGRLTLSDRILVAKGIAFLKEADWDRAVASTNTALNEDRNFHGVNPAFPSAIRPHLALGTELTQRLIRRLEGLVERSSFDGFDLPAFRAEIEALDAEVYAFHREAFDQEDALIATRIGDFRRSLREGFVLAGISVLLSAFLAFMVAANVVRRVLRISATTESFGQGDMTARVGNAGSDEIGDLARSFDDLADRVGTLTGNLEQLVAERTSQLTQRNREFALILDNAHEGMLTVDLHGKLSNERSAIIGTWFGEPEPNATLGQYLGRNNPTFAAMIDIGLDGLREAVLPPEVVLGQFPENLVQDGKHFRIAYRPVNEREVLTRLLVIVSDVTGEVEGRRATELQQETLRLFQACQRDRGGFLEFFVEAREIVERVCAIGGERSAELKRAVHTLKGNCALYGIFSVSELCHRLETSMEESGGVLSSADIETLRTAWRGLSETATQILGERAERKVELDDDEYGAIVDAIAHGTPRQDILMAIARWKLESSAQPLRRLAEQAKGVAGRMGKALDVRVEASDVRLCAEDWAPFWSALVHTVRNAIDHGIEDGAERARRGKPANGTLRLATRVADDRFLIEVSDDGRGVAWDRVAEKAKALGLAHGTRADLEEALFADGLSTTDVVTEISGRGIGMSAIRELCRNLGGRIEVDSEMGKGTTVRCSFPESAMGGRTFSAIASRTVRRTLTPKVA